MERFLKSDGKIHLLRTPVLEFLRKNEKLPDDAFMILDPGQLIDRYRLWMQSCPRVKPFYAAKCNDDIVILKTLAALGTGFDCASENELQKVVKMGVLAEDIIFANPTKQESHIHVAADLGVRKMTFDNEEELKKIKRIYPEAELVIRLRYDAKKTSRNLGSKFGAGFGDGVSLLMEAKRLGLTVIGLSFHLGSEIKDVEVFGNVIKSARTFFQVANEVGHQFSFLDIGGGFPGTLDSEASSMEEFGQIIGEAIDKYFPEEMGVTIISEPGRYFATSTCTLVTQIHSIRKLVDEDFMYYINDGTYGCLNCLRTGNSILVPECLKDTEGEKLFECSIWGPTCDSSDKLFESIMFPQLGVGDRIVFWNAGAYTLSAGGTFNGFPLPKVFYIADPSHFPELKKLLPLHCFGEELDHQEGYGDSSCQKNIHDFVYDMMGSLPSMLEATP